MRNHPFRRLVAQPNFVKLWLSQILSQLTINLVNFTILSRVFEFTRSATAVSLLWVAYSLPALFFAPFSGAIVDSFSRRKTMVVTNLLQAGSVALYFLVKQQIFALYTIVFLYSLLDQLYLPSQQASIPAVVSKKLLPAANGLFLLTQHASFLVGFGLGGIFLTLLGRDRTIVLSSLLLLTAGIAVFLLPVDSAKAVFWEKSLGQFWRDFKAGYRFVRGHLEVLFPLLTIVFAQVFITVIAVILPSYTRSVLGIGLNHASLAFVVPGSLGAGALTYFLPKFLARRRKKQIVETGLLIGGVCLGLLSLLPLLGRVRVAVAVVVAIGLGAAIAAVIVPSQTMLQEKTPAWFRGRVYGSLGFLLIMATAGPVFISATLVDLVGVTPVIAAIAGALFVGLIFTKKRGDYVLASGGGF